MFDHPWLCIGNDNAQGTNKNKNILCDLLIKHYSLTEWNNKLHSINLFDDLCEERMNMYFIKIKNDWIELITKYEQPGVYTAYPPFMKANISIHIPEWRNLKVDFMTLNDLLDRKHLKTSMSY